MTNRIVQLGLVFTIFSFLSNCTKEPDPDAPPNIIWLVAEDISPALGCYGDPLAITPNIDALAETGIRYEKAYATAPICAPSRSCLVTGLYATSLGTQHLRCEIPFPEEVLKTLPEYLQQAGYFTSNRNKTDYNFSPEGRWEHWSGSYAPWRNRKEGQPFFSFINVGPSHEGSVNRIERYREHVADLPEDQFTDPNEVSVPPYYPDTESTREVWAHYYDVLRVLDSNVGMIIDSLEADGLMEETIIFFFGDHGFGMPRYKRWLYNTGLNVPLIIHLPEKYQHLAADKRGSNNQQLVSFVDFAPTVLNLAGANIPDSMEGRPFLGNDRPSPRKEVFAARDRADDMFEMSRAVVTDQYIYIRHFMPHLPYIQSGYIYSDVKEAFKALQQARQAGLTNAEQEKLWKAKPIEELYDLQTDPKELQNLAQSEAHTAIKTQLRNKMHEWMITTRDLGLLAEAEYMIRSQGSSPYEYARNSGDFAVEDMLNAAEMVGQASVDTLLLKTQDEDSGVRYWAVMGLLNLPDYTPAIQSRLETLLNDPSPSVAILAAEAIGRNEASDKALSTLEKWVQDDRPWVALQAARSIQLIGENGRPLIPIMYEVLEKNLGEPGARLKYKDFNYAAFTSWALEWALKELGEDVQVN